MKLLFLSAFYLCSLYLHAQYKGGLSNGYGQLSVNNRILALADSVYNGGRANGFTFTNQNLELTFIDSLYTGGTANGYTFSSRNNTILAFTDSVYAGGTGNGFIRTIQPDISLSLLDSLYNGSIGRGEIMYTGTDINLASCSDTMVWNGSENINWHNPGNWDCATVPGVTSYVIIPSGRPRYPVVFLDTEIRRLTLRPGANLIVFANRRLTINGQ